MQNEWNDARPNSRRGTEPPHPRHDEVVTRMLRAARPLHPRFDGGWALPGGCGAAAWHVDGATVRAMTELGILHRLGVHQDPGKDLLVVSERARAGRRALVAA